MAWVGFTAAGLTAIGLLYAWAWVVIRYEERAFRWLERHWTHGPTFLLGLFIAIGASIALVAIVGDLAFNATTPNALRAEQESGNA